MSGLIGAQMLLNVVEELERRATVYQAILDEASDDHEVEDVEHGYYVGAREACQQLAKDLRRLMEPEEVDGS